MVVRDSVSGDPVVVASLSDGNYFGEISLLRLNGGTNRLKQSNDYEKMRDNLFHYQHYSKLPNFTIANASKE